MASAVPTIQTPAPSPTKRRRPTAAPPPSSSLVILLPPLLFSPALLPLFHAHFASYGALLTWTPLPHLERVVAVYDSEESAREARDEMDGFVWEDEDEVPIGEAPQPLRIFYGPTFSIHRLPASTDGTGSTVLLTVPSSGKNFLISPPGSPPVGWSQAEEEPPNAVVHHPEDDIQPVELGAVGGAAEFSAGWADELARALRFLSVDAGGDTPPSASPPRTPSPDRELEGEPRQTTQLVLPPSLSTSAPRPAVTVSSPAPAPPVDWNSTPGERPRREISEVKATLESMLGRKRSMSDLRRRSRSSSVSSTLGEELGAPAVLGGGLGAGGAARITPTARPPLA
ncbi:hypothetical protein JCM10213_007776 [Rhodosporidiobolus nylandii]